MEPMTPEERHTKIEKEKLHILLKTVDRIIRNQKN